MNINSIRKELANEKDLSNVGLLILSLISDAERQVALWVYFYNKYSNVRIAVTEKTYILNILMETKSKNVCISIFFFNRVYVISEWIGKVQDFNVYSCESNKFFSIQIKKMFWCSNSNKSIWTIWYTNLYIRLSMDNIMRK